MRVVKLSADVFADEAAVDSFFTNDLPYRDPPGLFHIGAQIAGDGLEPGERLLFTYKGHLRFVGLAETGRLPNTFGLQNDYPYCFIVKPRSIQPANASFKQIEQALAAVGVTVSLAGQGWTRVPDSHPAEQAIAALIGEA